MAGISGSTTGWYTEQMREVPKEVLSQYSLPTSSDISGLRSSMTQYNEGLVRVQSILAVEQRCDSGIINWKLAGINIISVSDESDWTGASVYVKIECGTTHQAVWFGYCSMIRALSAGAVIGGLT